MIGKSRVASTSRVLRMTTFFGVLFAHALLPYTARGFGAAATPIISETSCILSM